MILLSVLFAFIAAVTKVLSAETPADEEKRDSDAWKVLGWAIFFVLPYYF